MSLKEWYETFILWKRQISGCWIHPFLIQQCVIEFRFGSSEFLSIFNSSCRNCVMVLNLYGLPWRGEGWLVMIPFLCVNRQFLYDYGYGAVRKTKFQWCWFQPMIWLVTIGGWRKRWTDMGYCCGYSLEGLVLQG